MKIKFFNWGFYVGNPYHQFNRKYFFEQRRGIVISAKFYEPSLFTISSTVRKNSITVFWLEFFNVIIKHKR